MHICNIMGAELKRMVLRLKIKKKKKNLVINKQQQIPLERKEKEAGCGEIFPLVRELTYQQLARKQDFLLNKNKIK